MPRPERRPADLGCALLRVAMGRFDALDGLAAPALARTAAALDAAEAALADARAPLCERLHRRIGGLADDRRRHALLRLKRAVFNDRPVTGDGDGDGDLRTDPTLADALERWRAALARRDALAAELGRAWSGHEAASARRLRALFRRADFRLGLLFTNPALHADLDEALGDGGTRTRRVRRIEDTATAYLYRMATKTSPFSTFTGTAAVPFGDGWAGFDGGGTVTGNGVVSVAARIAQRVRAAALAAADLPLAVNATAHDDGETVLFVHRIDASDGADGAVPFVDEAFSWLPSGPAVAAVMAVLADRGPLAAAELARALADALGGRVPAGDALAYVGRLRATGLLGPHLAVGADRPDALSALAGALAAAGKAGGALATAAAEAEAGCRALAAARRPEDAAPTLAAVTTAVDHALAAAGAAACAGADGPLHAVRHDVGVAGAFALSRPALAGCRDALSLLAGAMTLFDGRLALRRLVDAFHRERYGAAAPPVPLTRFLHAFYADAYRPHLERMRAVPWDPLRAGAPATSDDAGAAVVAARTALVDALLGLAPAADGSVTVPPALFERAAAQGMAHWSCPAPPGIGCFGQILRPDGAARPNGAGGTARLVVNQIVSGYGTYFGRFLDGRLFDGDTARLRRQAGRALAALCPDAELVQIAAVFGETVQVAEPLTASVLVYPGEAVAPPDGAAVPWRALSVAADPETGGATLRNDATGRRVLLLRSGPMAPHLTPSLYRILATFGPGVIPEFTLVDLLESRAGPAGERARRFPALRLGDLVLMRETWRIPPGPDFPPVAGRRPPLDAFLAIRRWARRLDLPRRVFVTPLSVRDMVAGLGSLANLKRRYKPFYVDFDDPTACRLLQRFLAQSHHPVTVTAMAPGPQEMILARDGGRHASEVLLEAYWGGAP
ncbi:lantibiotic dehydratase [Azospirillum sp. ST 5-10]|uniref:lantibiotic dehydratase n=1 Tax=unclassified Azospirillum TaxID=2630922 RepID=UPI003F49D1D6